MSGLGHVFTHAMVWQLGKLVAIVAAMWVLRKLRIGRMLARWLRW